MSLLKQIEEKNAVVAWSSVPQHSNLLALGMKESAGAGFDDIGTELEIHMADFSKKDLKTKLQGSVRTQSRFTSIAWSEMASKKADFRNGLLAGGMLDGSVSIWDPAKLIAGHPQSRIAIINRHTSSVSALHFNPNKESNHLLASGGADCEVYVMALDRPETPNVFIPAPAPNTARHSSEITKIAWNSQVAHILATSSANGSCIVWDLRQKKPWCELRDSNRIAVTDIAWNPEEGLHLVTAMGDDNNPNGNPVIKLYDLRSSTTHPMGMLKGHTGGILSVSWCPHDPSFLLSCGKDNRTILWDLYKSEICYELQSQGSLDNSSQGYGAFGFGGVGSTSKRSFVGWSPNTKGVVATTSFNRTVDVYNLSGVRTSNARPFNWLRRPESATFGFGGKLTVVSNEIPTGKGAKRVAASKKPTIQMKTIVEDKELVEASRLFERALAAKDFQSFCATKAAGSRSTEERQVWNFMQVIFDADARTELNRQLGYDKQAAAKELAAKAASPLTQPTGDATATAQDIFSADVAATESVQNAIEDLSIDKGSNGKVDIGVPEGYTESEKEIKKALLVGNFETAVDTCLDRGLVAEAFLLASAGGAALWTRTKETFFAREGARRPLLKIIDAVIKSDLSDLVATSDLSQWRETLALISTYSKQEEFVQLCEVLGSRLETEKNDGASASLCYMCSVNVAKAMKFWKEEFERASKNLGHTDSIALHHFVEKVSIMLNAKSSGMQLPEDVKKLFAEYATLLAAQGELDIAAKYATSQDNDSAILMDRLWNASIQLQRSMPAAPVFPFGEQKSVGVSPSIGMDYANSPQRRKPVEGSAAVTSVPTPQPYSDPNALPPGWSAVVDATTKQIYYANAATGQTQWEKPNFTTPSPIISPGATIPAHPYAPQPTATNVYGAQPHATSAFSPTALGAVGGATPYAPTNVLNEDLSALQKFKKDGFVSSHGNEDLARKYGNVPVVGGQMGAVPTSAFEPAHAHGASPSIFNPNTAVPTNNPPVSAPSPAPVPPTQNAAPPKSTEIPPELKPIAAGLNGIVQQLSASPTLSAGDKRQLGDVNKALTVLFQKLSARELPGDVPNKLLEFVTSLQARDFKRAGDIQQDFVQTIWDQHKEWVKPLKVLVMLVKK